MLAASSGVASGSKYVIELETIKAEKAKKDIAGVGTASQKTETALGKMATRMAQIVRTMIALTIFRTLIGWMRDFAQGVIGASANLEMFNRQLEVLYRSARKAGEAMEFLKEYAIATPFILRDLLAGAVRLKAFSVDVTAYTKAVGDWAAAMNMTFQEMAVRFGKIVSGTKQTARLLATAGISTQEFNQALRQTGDRALALASIIAKKFPDMAKEISLTFSGLISNIKDIYILLMAQVGKELFGRLKDDTEAIHHWLREIYRDSERLSQLSSVFIIFYESIRIAIIDLTRFFWLVGNVVKILWKLKIVLLAIPLMFFAKLTKKLSALFIKMAINFATVSKAGSLLNVRILNLAWSMNQIVLGAGVLAGVLYVLNSSVRKLNRDLELNAKITREVAEGMYEENKIGKMSNFQLDLRISNLKTLIEQNKKLTKAQYVLLFGGRQAGKALQTLNQLRIHSLVLNKNLLHVLEQEKEARKNLRKEEGSNVLTLEKLNMMLKNIQDRYAAMEFPELEFRFERTGQALVMILDLEAEIIEASKEGNLVQEDRLKLFQAIKKIREEIQRDEMDRINKDKKEEQDRKNRWKILVEDMRLLGETGIMSRKRSLKLVKELLQQEQDRVKTANEYLKLELDILEVEKAFRDIDDQAMELEIERIRLVMRQGALAGESLAAIKSALKTRLAEIEAMKKFEGKEQAIIDLKNLILDIEEEILELLEAEGDAKDKERQKQIEWIQNYAGLVDELGNRFQRVWDADQSNLERRIEATKRQLQEEQGLIAPLTKQAQLEMQLRDLEAQRTTWTQRLGEEMKKFVAELAIAVAKATLLSTILSQTKMAGEKGLGFEDIFKSALFSFIPGGSFLEKIFTQRGYSGMVNRPTMFIAGEQGPEYVNVIPQDRTRGRTFERPMPSPEPRTISIEFKVEGDVYYDQKFEDRVEESLRKVASRVF